MAYYCLFAFVPAITAIVLMYAWFSEPAEISQHIAKASQFIPAEVNAKLEHQTKKDSTSGPEKPMSSRGAEMADTLGEIAPSKKARA